MAFIASCPCGYSKSLTEFYAGSKVRCPRCRSVIFVPVSDTIHDIDDLPDFDDSRRMRPVHPGEEAPTRPTAQKQSQSEHVHFSAQTRPQAYTPQPVDIPLIPKLPKKRTSQQQFNQIFDQQTRRSSGLLGFLASTAVLGGGVAALLNTHHPRGIILAGMALGVSMLYTWVRSMSQKGTVAGISAMLLSAFALILSFNNLTHRAVTHSIQILPKSSQDCPYEKCKPKHFELPGFFLPHDLPEPALTPRRNDHPAPTRDTPKERVEQDF